MRTVEEINNLIDETIEFYGKDPEGRRAVDESSELKNCEYLSDSGNKCAVGRCFNDRGLELFSERQTAYKFLAEDYDMDKFFKPQYKGFPSWVWNNLQGLHDSKDFWGTTGLTYQGEAYVREFKGVVLKGRDNPFLNRNEFLHLIEE